MSNEETSETQESYLDSGHEPNSQVLVKENEKEHFLNNWQMGEALRRWPIIVLFLVISGLGIISYCSFVHTATSAIPSAQAMVETDKPEEVSNNPILAKAPNGVMVESSSMNLPPENSQTIPTPAPTDAMSTAPAQPAMDMSSVAASPPPVDYATQEANQLRLQQEQEAAQVRAEKRAELKRAMEADSTVYSAYSGRSSGVVQASNEASNEGGPKTLTGRLSTLEGSSYLPHTRMPALSPYEVKAGAVIPAVMISGINSDLPGQLIAQVAQNVYDSATGNFILVPQGARLVGTYDNAVVQGQNRVLISWQRIIYPDASSLNIEAMPGQDQSGYAGFKDKTNNHTLPIFKNALLLSAITAGVQLSQPRAQKGDTYSSQQVVAGSLGMQLNQLGMGSYAGRMNTAPTITIRPGYKFNVMVNKDLILAPWQPGQGIVTEKIPRAIKAAFRR